MRKAVEGFRGELGDDHPATLYANNVLGRLLTEQGQLTEAEKITRENLTIQRRVLGEDHRETLSSLNNLASLLGDKPEAEACLREVIDKSRRVLGEEHPLTLNSIHNLGHIYYKQNQLLQIEHPW